MTVCPAARRIPVLSLCAALSACSDAKEARRVELQVVTDGDGLEVVTTDLGYVVELTSASVVASDLEFAIVGEAHTSFLYRLSDHLVPRAHAHPGHFQAGEITGELPGRYVLRFLAGETHELGRATLLVGKYKSANFTFGLAGADDVDEAEALLGHTALLAGTARKGDRPIAFTVALDSPEGRELSGVPFEQEVSEGGGQTLVLRLLTRDPLEQDTLFDGVDFAALDADADTEVRLDPAATDQPSVAAYNTIRRAFQTHDHFVVRPQSDKAH